MNTFSFRCKTQNMAYRVRDHPFFVRVNDADRNPTGRGGNDTLTLLITLTIEFNSKKAQPFTDAGSSHRAILTDTSCKYQRVQSAESRSKSSDPLLRLITK